MARSARKVARAAARGAIAALALLACWTHDAAAKRPRRNDSKKTYYNATAKPPGYRVIQRLALTRKVRDFRAHSPGVPLGGTRYLSIVSSQKKQVVHLVVLRKKGSRWVLTQRLALPPIEAPEDPRVGPGGLPKGSRCGRCPDQRIAAIVFARDYDKDGKPEALARTLYCYVMPAIGNVSYRRFFVINLDGKPRIALQASYGFNALPTAMGATHVRAKFRDKNGDGHPDVVLSSVREDPGGRHKASATVYLWQRASDSYRKKR